MMQFNYFNYRDKNSGNQVFHFISAQEKNTNKEMPFIAFCSLIDTVPRFVQKLIQLKIESSVIRQLVLMK